MPDDIITELLLRVARQDRAAFRQLYSEAAPKLTGVLLRILGNRAEVDDAMQDVFIKVWQRAASFQPDKGRGISWMIAVARNHALDQLRKRPAAAGMFRAEARDAEGQDPLEQVADGAIGVEQGMIAQGEARRVVDCFATLEEERSAAVKGAYIEGLSYQELAERFEVPLNTMRTWLRRSLVRLKECMDQ
ncbi:sigma-70 family RNA polymerase sigma factor [Pararhodobacter oceanensis]|uniref:sigma-70 family RNA polymerase sigma factor n=1 Tax=Pararhodobacter oceanensis TaxID=2172121 RepID=UPI003A94E401